MKKLIAALFMLLAFPAYAANCVSVVFYDATVDCSPASPPCAAQMTTRTMPWSQVATLDQDTNRLDLPVAAIHVFYNQFGVQGGPTVYQGNDDAFSLKYIVATSREARESLYVGNYVGNPARGSTTIFIAALDSSEDVQLFFTDAPARLSVEVLTGVKLFAGVSDAVSVVAFDLNLSCS